MPAVQVRDFPENTYEELKASAAQNHRSIAQQVIVAVEAMLAAENAGVPGEAAHAVPAHSAAGALYPPCTPSSRERIGTGSRQMRAQRRAELVTHLDGMSWQECTTSDESIATLVRTMRDERADTLIATVGEGRLR